MAKNIVLNEATSVLFLAKFICVTHIDWGSIFILVKHFVFCNPFVILSKNQKQKLCCNEIKCQSHNEIIPVKISDKTRKRSGE